jgi:hypothetical protein
MKSLKLSREVLVDALSQCSNRLQSLSVVVEAYTTTLAALQDSNFQYHSLMRLRIVTLQPYNRSNQPLQFLNPTASPEKIELRNVSIRSLQISWNRLTSAKIDLFDVEDLVQLFQHASQMTFCQLSSLSSGPFSMPPIIHHKLKTLDLAGPPVSVLGSLTLPCLQELHIFDFPTQLPALVRRSSCPLTKLMLIYINGELPFDELRPLPGVTDLVIEHLGERPDDVKRLLLEGYFPDLRHLTLRLQPFQVLWDIGVIHLLLDRKRRPEPKEGGLHRFVVDHVFEHHMWDSGFWEQVKALDIRMREDGFEFL